MLRGLSNCMHFRHIPPGPAPLESGGRRVVAACKREELRATTPHLRAQVLRGGVERVGPGAPPSSMLDIAVGAGLALGTVPARAKREVWPDRIEFFEGPLSMQRCSGCI